MVLLLLTLCACGRIPEPTLPATTLVVDGWIDAGGHPMVLLSRAVATSESFQDSAVLASKVVTYARVFVDDGTSRVELTGRRDDDYFPPYVYTSDAITGEVGGTYRLEVVCPGITAWSETTIPASAQVDHFRVEVSNRADSLYVLTACIEDNPATHDYYKVFTIVEGQHATWRPTLLSAVDDAMASSSNIDIPIARGWGALDKFRQTLFRKGEKVRVKFCTMDAASYSFWTSFDDVCILGRNPFFPSTSDARSNVHGGLGAWCGYGATEYAVEIQ